MNTLDLKIGNVYRVTHKRKGTFVAQLINVVDTDPRDTTDDCFLTMKYDVRAGTDQVGLAIAPGKDSIRVSNLRPSLVLRMEELEGEDWLRQIKVAEEATKPLEPAVPEHGLLKRLERFFKH